MKYFVCSLLILFCIESFGARLSNEALFNRCYSHLTKKRLNSSHPLLARVKSGSLDPIDACLGILNKASLRNNGRLSVNDAESRAVVKVMTDFHNSTFSEKTITTPNSCFRQSTLDFVDELTPALYFTKALLKSDTKLSDIFTGTTEVRSIRTNPSNDVGPVSGTADHVYETRNGNDERVNTPWDVSSAFLDSGALIGVSDAPSLILPQYNTNVLDSLGGGILGSRVYLQRASRNQSERSDGGNRMNRRWAQAVARDFLCRELPLIRESDGLPFVKTSSSIAFKTQSACVACHATMDRLAGAVRGVSRVTPGRDDCSTRDGIARTEHYIARTPDRGPASIWPENPDRDYYRRPAEGYLYFRSYNGDLIHKKFSNLEELGQSLADTNDFYVCAAKKYYQFFTGIEVSLADINDPFSSVRLNNEDLKHRNKVIQMGLALKSHQSLGRLLRDIIGSPGYKLSDYGIQGGD